MANNEENEQSKDLSATEDSNEIHKLIFEKLSNNDTNAFQQLIMQLKDGVNFVDETGMTPLQHACCKANKEAVEILLNMVIL